MRIRRLYAAFHAWRNRTSIRTQLCLVIGTVVIALFVLLLTYSYVTQYIVFVDMNMPVMDGVAFLSLVSEKFPAVRCIVVSGYDSFDFARAAIRSNVVDYLLKPIDVDDLEAALRKAISLLPEKPKESRLPADIAREIKAYIDAHYGEDISLDLIAEKFYFSREYAGRIFRAQYGCAIYEYIQQVRMEKAGELLKNDKLSLQTVSDALGYSNANYFSKAFRRHYGMSPSEYRRSR